MASKPTRDTHKEDRMKHGESINIYKRYRGSWNSQIDVDKFFFEGQLDEPEPEVCSQFGCGATLSSEEKLYGNRCVKHQNKMESLVDKYIAK